MPSTLILALGFLAHAAGTPPTRSSDSAAVRVWLPDTVRPVGAPVQVYVALRDSSYLVVLHADASGRIRVLYPRNPTDPTLVPGGETFAITGREDGSTFRVPVAGTGLVLAVRSWTPFRFDGLAIGGQWDYDHALLFLPTAGSAFAALLDIADRIAGEGYNYDLAEYRTPGAVTRVAARDSVCFTCLAARRSGHVEAGAGLTNSAIANDHSYAAAPGGTVVDCSSTTLVDSYCGVQDNSVTNNVTEETTVEQSTVVYPVLEPVFFPIRRFRRPPRAPAPPPPAIALNLRRVPGRIVPPAPLRPPHIVVQQPRAASHPDAVAPPDAAPDQGTPVTPMRGFPARFIVRRSPPVTYAPAAAATSAAGQTMAGTMHQAQTVASPRSVAAGAASAGGQTVRSVIVPSRAVARAYANPRR
jgi:uncharacterized protein DUF4384